MTDLPDSEVIPLQGSVAADGASSRIPETAAAGLTTPELELEKAAPPTDESRAPEATGSLTGTVHERAPEQATPAVSLATPEPDVIELPVLEPVAASDLAVATAEPVGSPSADVPTGTPDRTTDARYDAAPTWRLDPLAAIEAMEPLVEAIAVAAAVEKLTPATMTSLPASPASNSDQAAARMFWFATPVFALVVPDSLLARGNAGRSITPSEPETVGFGDVEDAVEAPLAAVFPKHEPANDRYEESPSLGGPPADAPADPDAEIAAPASPTEQVSPAEPAAAGDDALLTVAEVAPSIEAEAVATAVADAAVPTGEIEVPAAIAEMATQRDDWPLPAPVTPLARAERPLGAPSGVSPRGPGEIVSDADADSNDAQEASQPPIPFEEHRLAIESVTDETALEEMPAGQPTMRNRRLYRRTALEAALEVNGMPARLLDVSMGGFGAGNAPSLAPDSVVPVSIRLSVDGVEISTAMQARIIYSGAPRTGGRFVDLTPSQTAFLRCVVTWRGQTVGALGTTTLLDAITRSPVHGRAPLLEPPGSPEARHPWWMRCFGRLARRR